MTRVRYKHKRCDIDELNHKHAKYRRCIASVNEYIASLTHTLRVLHEELAGSSESLDFRRMMAVARSIDTNESKLKLSNKKLELYIAKFEIVIAMINSFHERRETMIIILSKDDSESVLNKKRKEIQEMLDSNPKLAASYKIGEDGSTEVSISESVDFLL